jgi:hypothetical protein
LHIAFSSAVSADTSTSRRSEASSFRRGPRAGRGLAVRLNQALLRPRRFGVKPIFVPARRASYQAKRCLSERQVAPLSDQMLLAKNKWGMHVVSIFTNLFFNPKAIIWAASFAKINNVFFVCAAPTILSASSARGRCSDFATSRCAASKSSGRATFTMLDKAMK